MARALLLCRSEQSLQDYPDSSRHALLLEGNLSKFLAEVVVGWKGEVDWNRYGLAVEWSYLRDLWHLTGMGCGAGSPRLQPWEAEPCSGRRPERGA